MADYIPKFIPGDAVTFTASAAVTGGRLVAASGERTVEPAGANSASVVGVAGRDAALGEQVTVYIGRPVQRLIAAGAITAGDQVGSAAAGKVSASSGVVFGIALTSAAKDGDPVDVLFTSTPFGVGGEAGTTWAAVTGKPAVIAAGANKGAARAAVDAVDAAGAVAAVKAKTEINALAAVSAADATDEATAVTLANALKTAVNAIVAALKA